MTDLPIAKLPEGYASWLAELKTRIAGARQRAVLSVNQEQIRLYWQMAVTFWSARAVRAGARR